MGYMLVNKSEKNISKVFQTIYSLFEYFSLKLFDEKYEVWNVEERCGLINMLNIIPREEYMTDTFLKICVAKNGIILDYLDNPSEELKNYAWKNCDSMEKWQTIIFHSEKRASEILNCNEAREELDVEELKDIISWAGDDEYGYIGEDKMYYSYV